MKAVFSRQIFEKFSNIKFHENSSIGSRLLPCWPTDKRTETTKQIAAYHNFAKTSTNLYQGQYYAQQSYTMKFKYYI
jgi:hypothetical protein